MLQYLYVVYVWSPQQSLINTSVLPLVSTCADSAHLSWIQQKMLSAHELGLVPDMLI